MLLRILPPISPPYDGIRVYQMAIKTHINGENRPRRYKMMVPFKITNPVSMHRDHVKLVLIFIRISFVTPLALEDYTTIS